MDLYKIYDKVSKKSDQSALKAVELKTTQVRFSNNAIDIINTWSEEYISVFMAKGKKTFSFELKDEGDLDDILAKATNSLESVEDNHDFFSLNDNKYTYRKMKKDYSKLLEIEPEKFVGNFIEQAKPFFKRTGGVFYSRKVKEEILTPFNSGTQEHFGVEFVARAFNDQDYPVQTSFMSSSDDDIPLLERQLDKLIELSRNIKRISDGREGKYNVIFTPLCFASLVSYTIPMASTFQVDSGMSIFAGRLGEKIGSSSFTLYDDPTDDSMINAKSLDDEGTPTQKTPVIEKGVVKGILHNFSTAKKFNTKTTGNAGIIAPSPWQISVEPGNEEIDDMISSTKKGLLIVNTWYTRFQDYRQGIFSTIPRDGIFYIENGEVKEAWKGVRISDSLLNIYRNIEGITRETEKVKWWDETLPTKSPYVEVADVNISRSR
ncbi:MAG: metallopeptidase TldD-related protein [Thermoplasmatales archaeon]